MRLELSRKSDLAVRALCALTREDRLKARDLARAIDTTATFLPQVMAPLVRAEWVRSDRGPNGGYELAVPLAEISMLVQKSEMKRLRQHLLDSINLL